MQPVDGLCRFGDGGAATIVVGSDVRDSDGPSWGDGRMGVSFAVTVGARWNVQ